MPTLGYVLKFALNLLNTPINLGVYTITPLGFLLTVLVVGCVIRVVRKFFD